MEVRYRREMKHNYMIMDAPEQAVGYECRMLAGNHIEGLLKFRLRHGEEKQEFYYEITSRQPLTRVLEKRKAAGEEIRRVLVAVMTAVNRTQEYLLKEEQLLLDPDYIYVDPDRFTVELCLLPGHTCDWPAALSELLKFLLEKADHQDKDGVILAYNLYQESLKENYGAADLLKHLSPAEDKIFAKASDRMRQEYEKEGCETEAVYESEKPYKPELPYPPETKRDNGAKVFVKRSRGVLSVVQGLLILALAETAVWYMTGSRGMRTYGAAAAGIVLLIFLLKLLLQNIFQRSAGTVLPEKDQGSEPLDSNSKEDKGNSSKTIATDHRMLLREPACSALQPDIGTSPWELRVESEEIYQSRMQQKSEEEMKKSREEGTVLLTGEGKAGRIGVLEPLSRDGESIEISYVPFTIGKHPQLTDYCLSRSTVSRLHLRIDKKENVCIITDLNSTNGTTVNGYQLQSNETVSIKTGDIIYLADTGFRFHEQR